MTEQEYRQYINENYSLEEAHLYEDMYNEGAIWNGIKSIGKALFNRNTNQTLNQNIASNYTNYKVNSQKGIDSLDKKVGKASSKAADETTLQNMYTNALKQFALDIAQVQSNGLFGKGTYAQRKLNKNQQNTEAVQNTSSEATNNIQATLKTLTEEFPGISQDKLLQIAQNVDPKTLNLANKKAKAQFMKQHGLYESKIVSLVGHFLEDLTQGGPMATLLSKWGLTADSNGNIDTKKVWNYLQGLSSDQIQQFAKEFYSLDKRSSAQGHYNTLLKAINDQKTLEQNEATRQQMLNPIDTNNAAKEEVITDNQNLANSQNVSPNQASKTNKPNQSGQPNILTGYDLKLFKQRLGGKLATVLQNNGILNREKNKDNINYINRCVTKAISSLKGQQFTSTNLAQPLLNALKDQNIGNPPCVNDQNQQAVSELIRSFLKTQIKEALLLSQFLNRYYF